MAHTKNYYICNMFNKTDQEIDSGSVAINEAISDNRNVEETNPGNEFIQKH